MAISSIFTDLWTPRHPSATGRIQAVRLAHTILIITNILTEPGTLKNDTASIAMNFCMSGPKVDNTLKDNHISIETGYICEGDTVIPFIASTLPGPAEPNDMNRPELNQTAPSTDNKKENIMREYSVRITLSEMTIVAESTERAEEIAADIFESDAYTKLHHGLCIEDIEIEDYGPSDETEETEL